MALQSSGAISLNNVNVELGISGTATITMNDTAVRALAGIASGQIRMSDFYGKAFLVDIQSVTATRRISFEGNPGSATTTFADTSSYAHTLNYKSTDPLHRLAVATTGAPNYTTTYRYSSHIPPAQSRNSPFLPSDYWGLRFGPYFYSYGYSDPLGMHCAYNIGDSTAHSLGNTWTLEFFYKPDTASESVQAGNGNIAEYWPAFGGGWLVSTVGPQIGSPTWPDGLQVSVKNGVFSLRRGWLSASTSSISTYTTVLLSSGKIMEGNNWYHCCIHVAPGVGKMFINGQCVATNNFSYSTWKYNKILGPVTLPGTISNFRLVSGSLVYANATPSTQTSITVPTSALTDISGTQILTGIGPQFKNYASNATYAFTVSGAFERAVAIIDSPFTNKTAYNNSTHGGSILFSTNSGIIFTDDEFSTTGHGHQSLYSSTSAALSSLGGYTDPQANTFSVSPFTIDVWVKKMALSSGGSVPIVFFTGNGSWWGGLYISEFNSGTGIVPSDNAGPRLLWVSHNGAIDFGEIGVSNQWTHIAVQFVPDGTGYGARPYVYVNGVNRFPSSGASPGTMSYSTYAATADQNLLIGAMPGWIKNTAGSISAPNWAAQATYGAGKLKMTGTVPFYLSNLRISNIARYSTSSNISVPTGPYTSDANTVFLLYTNLWGYNDSVDSSAIAASVGFNTSSTVARSGSLSLYANNPIDYLSYGPAGSGIGSDFGAGYYGGGFYATDDNERSVAVRRGFGDQYNPVLRDATRSISGGSTLEFHFYIPSSQIAEYNDFRWLMPGISLQRETIPATTLSLTVWQAAETWYNPNGSSLSLKTGITSDAWHHIAIVVWNYERRVYLDGVLIAMSSIIGSNDEAARRQIGAGAILLGTGSNAVFGGANIGLKGVPYITSYKYTTSLTRNFWGYIDNVRAYNNPKYFGNFTPSTDFIGKPSSNIFYYTSTSNKMIGGEILDANGYRYHIFRNSGRLYNIGGSAFSFSALLVGGGGGGGYRGGGGGGGGVLVTSTSLNGGEYVDVFIGAGGASGGGEGGDGGTSYITEANSSNISIAAGGGGGGGGSDSNRNGRSGVTPTASGAVASGSGGGGAGNLTLSPGTGGGGAYGGGNATFYVSTGYAGGGGGGGFGAGANATNSNNLAFYGGGGGNAYGFAADWLYIQASPGGGGYSYTSNSGIGGNTSLPWRLGATGGYRNLADPYLSDNGPTLPNTFGAGGGAGFTNSASGDPDANGAPGIVIVKYAIP